jgi:hypothetical protein
MVDQVVVAKRLLDHGKAALVEFAEQRQGRRA